MLNLNYIKLQFSYNLTNMKESDQKFLNSWTLYILACLAGRCVKNDE